MKLSFQTCPCPRPQPRQPRDPEFAKPNLWRKKNLRNHRARRDSRASTFRALHEALSFYAKPHVTLPAEGTGAVGRPANPQDRTGRRRPNPLVEMVLCWSSLMASSIFLLGPGTFGELLRHARGTTRATYPDEDRPAQKNLP